jgi:hypothetical protein
MVYVLQNFRHYLLGSYFKIYTYHYALIYLVKKRVLGGGGGGGGICKWLLFSKNMILKSSLSQEN